MPKVPQPKHVAGALSPWAYVLRDYMWNRRAPNEPPRTAGQIAARLGQRRQTVYSWLEGTTPDVHTLFAVMAQLNIPIERLAEGYAQAELSFPPLTNAEAAALAASASAPTASPAPHPRPARGRGAAAAAATAATPPDEWEDLIASTTDSLRQYGVPEAAIAATVANIRATGASQPHPLQRHVTAEHTEPQPEPERPDAPAQQPPEARRPHTKRR